MFQCVKLVFRVVQEVSEVLSFSVRRQVVLICFSFIGRDEARVLRLQSERLSAEALRRCHSSRPVLQSCLILHAR